MARGSDAFKRHGHGKATRGCGDPRLYRSDEGPCNAWAGANPAHSREPGRGTSMGYVQSVSVKLSFASASQVKRPVSWPSDQKILRA